MWIDNQIVRVDADPKLKRLGGRVQVIQDRIIVSEENRARLVEAIETALRFGKGKINIIPQDIGRVILNLINNAFYAVNEKRITAGEKYQPSRPPDRRRVGCRYGCS